MISIAKEKERRRKKTDQENKWSILSYHSSLMNFFYGFQTNYIAHLAWYYQPNLNAYVLSVVLQAIS